jgi:NAD(P)-dependent dehydrogenase (short-subunit alcohol dehydrogenase family)
MVPGLAVRRPPGAGAARVTARTGCEQGLGGAPDRYVRERRHSPRRPSLEPAARRRGVAVVTGGSAGLGRAVVRELTGLGYDVAVLARESERLHGAVREVDLAGRRGLALAVDVADAAAVDLAAERVERELGPIDVWVNNAMTSVFAPFLEVEPDEFERATQVTYLGFVNGTRAALRRMVPRDAGHVVQVGSSLAYRGIPLQSAYCGAKHAMVGFTESVQAELDHDGSAVQVSMVHMPALNTPSVRLGAVAAAEAPAAGAADLPARGRRPRRRLRRPAPAAAHRRHLAHRGDHPRQRRRSPPARLVRGEDGRRGPADRRGPAGPRRQPRQARARGPRAHGSFGHRAKTASPQTWLNLRLGHVVGTAAGVAGGAVRGLAGAVRR